MSRTGAPSPRSRHTASWTGNRIIYWGGVGTGGAPLNTGGVYNVYDNTWDSIPTAGAPTARSGHISQFLGGADVAIWGGQSSSARSSKTGPS